MRYDKQSILITYHNPETIFIYAYHGNLIWFRDDLSLARRPWAEGSNLHPSSEVLPSADGLSDTSLGADEVHHEGPVWRWSSLEGCRCSDQLLALGTDTTLAGFSILG